MTPHTPYARLLDVMSSSASLTRTLTAVYARMPRSHPVRVTRFGRRSWLELIVSPSNKSRMALRSSQSARNCANLTAAARKDADRLSAAANDATSKPVTRTGRPNHLGPARGDPRHKGVVPLPFSA